MRRWIEGLESFAMDVILDRRYGRRAGALRWILSPVCQKSTSPLCKPA